MSHDEILRKIVQLRIDKNWSEYRLSMETGIPQSTISSWFRKNVQPSVQSLAAICQACGITLSQFFSSDEDLTVELTVEQKDFQKYPRIQLFLLFLSSIYNCLASSLFDILLISRKSCARQNCTGKEGCCCRFSCPFVLPCCFLNFHSDIHI